MPFSKLFSFLLLSVSIVVRGQQPRLVIPEGHTESDGSYKYESIRHSFSPDSKLIATGKASELKVWDVRSGKLITTIFAYENGITAVCFTSDNKSILTSGYDMGQPSRSSVKIWSLETGESQLLVSIPETQFFNDIDITDDGSRVICTGDSLLIIYNLIDRKIEKKIKINGASATYRLDDKGRFITIGSPNKIWSLKGEERDFQNDWPIFGEHNYLFSKNSLITSREDTVTQVSLRNFELINRFVFDYKFRRAALTNDDQYLVVQAYPDSIFVWDIIKKQIIFSDSEVENFQINSEMGYLLIKQKGIAPLIRYFSDLEKAIDIVDSADKKYAYCFSSFSADYTKIIVSRSNSFFNMAIDIIDAKTFRKISCLEGHALAVEYATFNKSGTKLFTSSVSYYNHVFDVFQGKMIGRFILTSKEQEEDLALNDTIINGRQVLFAQGIYEPSAVMGASIIDTNLNLICTFYPIDSTDYVTLVSGGYYQSSPGAAKLLHYVTKDLKVITFEQLDVKYNRPDKVLEAIGNTDTALINSYRKAWEKRIKKLGIDTTAFRDGYSVPEADFANRDAIEYEQKNGTLQLHIKGIDSTYKLDRFNIWVNETPLIGQRGVNIKRKNSNSIDTTITIKLSQGENRIETSISNVNGTESYRMPLQVNYTPAVRQKESTWFIGIGIDQFSQSEYNLQYSTKDIRDLSVKLKEKYKGDIIIDTLFNEQVTISNVKALKKKLQQTTENDKVIIAYSGHGMLSKEYDYYLSTYPVNFEKPEQGGLPYDELENLLDSIPARKKLMLIDACHSGEVDKEERLAMNKTADSLGLKTKGVIVTNDQQQRVGLKNSFELMQSLFVNVGKSTGATIISAAAGNQYALEGVNNLPNGVFTYSILEAMNKYPIMKISELKKIVGEKVEELTKGLQKPTSRNEAIAVDWEIWSLQ